MEPPSSSLGVEAWKQIVLQAPDALVGADPEGTIVVWNRAAERLFGLAAADAIGRSLDLIIPERFRDAHWTGFHRSVRDGTMRLGEGRPMRTRSMRPDGSRLYVDLSFSLLRDEAGAVVGVLAAARESASSPGNPASTGAAPSGD